MSSGPAEPGSAPAVRARDRAGAWLVTGPLGRLAAFLVILAAALWRALSRRAPGLRQRFD